MRLFARHSPRDAATGSLEPVTLTLPTQHFDRDAGRDRRRVA
jgi:hypothetical protein